MLAWILFAVGAGIAYLLAESGPRMAHGNMVWSAQIAVFILFVQSAAHLSTYFGGVLTTPARGERWRATASLGCLLLHTAFGIALYFAEYARVGKILVDGAGPQKSGPELGIPDSPHAWPRSHRRPSDSAGFVQSTRFFRPSARGCGFLCSPATRAASTSDWNTSGEQWPGGSISRSRPPGFKQRASARIVSAGAAVSWTTCSASTRSHLPSRSARPRSSCVHWRSSVRAARPCFSRRRRRRLSMPS